MLMNSKNPSLKEKLQTSWRTSLNSKSPRKNFDKYFINLSISTKKLQLFWVSFWFFHPSNLPRWSQKSQLLQQMTKTHQRQRWFIGLNFTLSPHHINSISRSGSNLTDYRKMKVQLVKRKETSTKLLWGER